MQGFLLTLWIASFVVFVLPKIWPKKLRFKLPEVEIPDPPEPPRSVIRLYDGPSNGYVQELRSEAPDFFIAPYIPTDENGNPNPDEANIVQSQGGYIQVKPNYAWYQQITEEDYFYVRDISLAEVEKIRLTGEMPELKKEEDGD